MPDSRAQAENDTIFASATPPGAGGIGVTRLSGPAVPSLAESILGFVPKPRYATLVSFKDGDSQTIDSGIALYFPAPHSFTGEHVLELQGHGGTMVQHQLAQRLLALGARAARPGEFSERAFLNNKLDLAQAEAIADLVSAGTAAAARAAQRSLEGVFSEKVNDLLASLTSLRVFIEAALDFPEEEIDFIGESDVVAQLDAAIAKAETLLREAFQGRLLRDGISVAIVGKPNAGKSSLLNALAGTDTAIVTDIPGTTRDVLRETISIDGLPVHVADTAGIRDSEDRIEAEGVRRARITLEQADIALLVRDLENDHRSSDQAAIGVAGSTRIITVWNKADLSQAPGELADDEVVVSAKTGAGLSELRARIRETAGVTGVEGGSFSARTRHVNALRRTLDSLRNCRSLLVEGNAPEIVAEELRLSQFALGEITGQFLPDDLLGAIFANFCIGK